MPRKLRLLPGFHARPVENSLKIFQARADQMNKHSVVGQFLNALRRFRGASAGNVAMTFALATVPIIGFVGSAVDYSRANSTKAAMQSALDATALMLSKKASGMTAAQISSSATSYFNALFTRPEAKNVVVTAAYSSSSGSQILLNGSASVSTNFMGVMGYQSLPINVTSTAKWGTSRLRVALVLDNTGSMADNGKMTALKSATTNLLSQLQSAATNNGDVYVSIIPFAKDVNVGSSNYNASWIDWTDWNTANTSCSGFQFGNFCFGSYVTANHNTWNGCITDRGLSATPNPYPLNFDQIVTAPGTTAAEQYNACPVAMMGLSYDWTALNNLVNTMTPNGGTNQPIGLVWGWQSLVGGGPLTAPAMDSGYTYTQVIILLSDGLNTQDRWYGDGTTTNTSVDGRMYASDGSGTCANAKAAGVVIYTIQVNTANDPTSTLLQNCASSSDKFSQVTSASQITTIFNSIGTALTKLRLAN
jgi:Flp pilus assembly protein TadG